MKVTPLYGMTFMADCFLVSLRHQAFISIAEN